MRLTERSMRLKPVTNPTHKIQPIAPKICAPKILPKNTCPCEEAWNNLRETGTADEEEIPRLLNQFFQTIFHLITLKNSTFAEILVMKMNYIKFIKNKNSLTYFHAYFHESHKYFLLIPQPFRFGWQHTSFQKKNLPKKIPKNKMRLYKTI